jgi:hypothetical protein
VAIAAGVIEDRLPCGRPRPKPHYSDWASIWGTNLTPVQLERVPIIRNHTTSLFFGIVWARSFVCPSTLLTNSHPTRYKYLRYLSPIAKIC